MSDQRLAEHLQTIRHPAAPSGDGPRVLVVEPNSHLRHALVTLLWARKVIAAETADAEGAVKAVREWRPTVAVVEPRMPEVGLKIISMLLEADQSLKVIAYTSDSPGCARNLHGSGIHQLIYKGTGVIADLLEGIPAAHGAYADSMVNNARMA